MKDGETIVSSDEINRSNELEKTTFLHERTIFKNKYFFYDRNEKTPPLAFGPTILTQLYFFVAHDIYISKL